MLAYTAVAQGKFVTLTCSDGRTLTTDQWDEVAGFLVFPTDFCVVWQVDLFLDALCTTLSLSLAKEIKAGGRVYTPDNRKLFYIPSRIFTINYINFYSLSRYNDKPLTDAQDLFLLGERVIKTYETMFNINVKKLTSPVAAFGDLLEQIPFPRAYDLPDSAFDLLNATTQTMSREWREVYQLGHWNGNEIGDYDLSSAYPSIAAKLPDITDAQFFRSKTIPDKYSWGELHGKLRITKDISPFINLEKNAYAKGGWEDSITSDQLWLLRKWNIGNFEMEYGDFFLLPDDYGYPFKTTMEQLHIAKLSQNRLISNISKGISVGIVGKLAERHGDSNLGDAFNSIYARMVTSRCSVRVADFIYRNGLENNLVSVLVDGFLATKRLPIVNSKEMGTWKINEPEPTLVLSLLYQWHGDKKPGKITYAEIVDLIKQHPNQSVYGDIDFNLLSYDRNFPRLPHTGGELLDNKYTSEAIINSSRD